MVEKMIDRLAVVNYYRLSGDWHPFRNPTDAKVSYAPRDDRLAVTATTA